MNIYMWFYSLKGSNPGSNLCKEQALAIVRNERRPHAATSSVDEIFEIRYLVSENLRSRIIDIKYYRLLKFCYVPATSAACNRLIFFLFLLRTFTVLMKQTRQVVCIIKQSIFLRCLCLIPLSYSILILSSSMHTHAISYRNSMGWRGTPITLITRLQVLAQATGVNVIQLSFCIKKQLVSHFVFGLGWGANQFTH